MRKIKTLQLTMCKILYFYTKKQKSVTQVTNR